MTLLAPSRWLGGAAFLKPADENVKGTTTEI